MLKPTGLVTLALALARFTNAASPEWGQCGGIGWTGDTTCVSGTVCTVLNAYYFQCLPGASTTSAPPSTSSAPTSTSPASTSSVPAPPAATGFVGVSGQKFTLNGQTFPLVGANSYWVGLMGYSTSDMNKAFSDIAATGATTVRTWGFNDVTTANGIYYQLWQNGKATVNTGSTGLGNFDNVVAAAKANGLRLIVSLTNNWSDYGGMDVYVSQITGTQNHDYFYTNANVIAAYKSYIQTFVGRYKNEPTILAWELANEPRCTGSTGTSTGTCNTATITQWASQISAFIKSIDSNHLVAIGDEGFFNEPSNPSYPYQGSEGIDFNANLNISTLDFGTAHLYPGSWGITSDPTGWGSQWITDHATSGKAVNKPVILEEFGVTDDQASTYTTWYNTIITSGLTGDLIWQAGSHLSAGNTPDDGYTIYPDDPVYPIESQHAAAIKARG
ncbi:CEL4a mannanase [Dichomitus squalens LYAD-421 SS1]|uniref:CEL4a mannanase n=1 Tax=Dichomitus squalens (strain LYAD-421) TaxID=732165 RepID=UPI0004415D67|nr:CEL4a mannanase [Dichomitus squalens LYAD-421 SS1]EJF65264.1 CEL4a mannanase [Dichomitus squalens LYAD-421 SS1]